jgi:ribosomal protein S12 methylthiotransferase accessory factor YcaO
MLYNGNAAGNTPEEAILRDFFELVERDASHRSKRHA